MAIYRNVQTTFWTDAKVVDNFTPEDRYFYLYLLTNPHTNLAGCYEISFKQISDETGYTKEVVERLLDRMENVHDVVRYSKITKELLIINWSKFNWTRSKDFQKCLKKEIEKVKSKEFQAFLTNLLDGAETVLGRSKDPVGTTDSVTDTYTPNLHETKDVDVQSKDCNKAKDNYMDSIKDILDYLNQKTGKHYTTRNKANVTTMRERLKEGYTVEDFKKIIDTKFYTWKNTEWEMYLRPETLFCPKHFESYLNESIKPEPPKYEPPEEKEKEWTPEEWEQLRRDYPNRFDENGELISVNWEDEDDV